MVPGLLEAPIVHFMTGFVQGPYDNLHAACEEFMTWIKERNLRTADDFRKVYNIE